MTIASTPTVPADQMVRPVVQVVVDMIDEIPDVVTIRTVPVDGEPFPFLPAQVSMVGAFGIGEATISISSPPHERAFHEYTIRRAGAITSALTRMAQGDHFWVRGPFGAAWDLDLDGEDVVIAAGGIGLAPLRSAVYALLERRERIGRMVLVVGARRSADLLYQGEYDEWRRRGLEVVPTVDRPEPGWSGRTGFVPRIVDELDLEPRLVHALICGPDVMMELTARTLEGRGVSPERIQLTMERNMQCGTGRCGHCQLGGLILCRDGPVVRYPSVRGALNIGEW